MLGLHYFPEISAAQSWSVLCSGWLLLLSIISRLNLEGMTVSLIIMFKYWHYQIWLGHLAQSPCQVLWASIFLQYTWYTNEWWKNFRIFILQSILKVFTAMDSGSILNETNFGIFLFILQANKSISSLNSIWLIISSKAVLLSIHSVLFSWTPDSLSASTLKIPDIWVAVIQFFVD